MKNIPIRFNPENPEERLDMIIALLEISAMEGDLVKIQSIIRKYLDTDDAIDIHDSIKGIV